MEQPRDPDEEVPRVVRRDEAVHPAWFIDPEEQGRIFEAERAVEAERRAELAATEGVPWSVLRKAGFAVLGLIAVFVPVRLVVLYLQFDIGLRPLLLPTYFVVLIVEPLAVWGLIRLAKRR